MGMFHYSSFIFFILLVRLDFCKVSGAVEYIYEEKFECHYVNGTQRVRILHRCLYNEEEQVYFDSDVGKYIAKTEYGRPDADYWNSNKEIIEQRRNELETVCKHNYGVFEGIGAIGRKVKPEVTVSQRPQHSSTGQHMLMCNVFGFYPSEVEVKWYRNGEEETELVQSTELFQNGDWTYQIMVMLETEIEKHDTFTCEVHHISLETPHRVDWHPKVSDSAKNKMATGIVGFVLGAVFLIAGIVIYMRGQKVQAFRGPQSENFINS